MNDKELVLEEKKRYASLEALINSDGGKILLKDARRDINNSINTLISEYKESSYMGLVVTIAKLENRIELYNKLSKCEENNKLCDQALDEILKNE